VNRCDHRDSDLFLSLIRTCVQKAYEATSWSDLQFQYERGT